MAHTGPWEVREAGEWTHITTDGGVPVATVSGYPVMPHANLLAAAPELLEALKEAADCLDHSAPTKGTYTDRTLKQARAAIKKAGG